MIGLTLPAIMNAQTKPSITYENGNITISSTGGGTLWYNTTGGYPTNNESYSQFVTPDAKGNTSVTINAEELPEGHNNQYLKVVCDGLTEDPQNWDRQLSYKLSTPLSVNTDYIVTARIKASSSTFIQLWPTGSWVTENNETQGVDPTMYVGALQPVTSGWTDYTWNFRIENSNLNINKLNIVFGKLDGEICFDDVVLRRVGHLENLIGKAEDGNRTSHFYGGDYQYTNNQGVVTEGWSLVTAPALANQTTLTTDDSDCIIQAFSYKDANNFSAFATYCFTNDNLLDIDFSNHIEDGICKGEVGEMVFTFNKDYPFELGYTNDMTTVLNDVLRVGRGEARAAIADDLLPTDHDIVTVSFDLWVGYLVNRIVEFAVYDTENKRIGGCSINKYTTDNNTQTYSDFGEIQSWFSSLGNSNTNNDKIYTEANKSSVTLTFDYSRNLMKATVVNRTTGPHESKEVVMKSQGAMKYFVLSSNYHVNDRRCWFDNLKVSKQTSNTPVVATSYKVKYLYEETELQPAKTFTGYVGQSIIIDEADRPNRIDTADETYYYVSDDASEQTIQEAGQTVVSIQYRKQYNFSYEVLAVDEEGHLLKEIAQGAMKENQAPQIVYYSKSIKVDNIYYDIERMQGNLYYGIPVSDGTFEVKYKKCADNVEYYSEIENMNLHLNGKDFMGETTADERYSEGEAKRLNRSQYVYTDALEGGVYDVTLYARNAKDRPYKGIGARVADGTGQLFTPYTEFEEWYNARCEEHTIRGLIVPPGYNLQIGEMNGTNNEMELDYVRVVRTGDCKTISSSNNLKGWKNFFDAEQSWELDSLTSIYRVEAGDADSYIVRRVKDNKIIPAGNAVILRTTNDVDNIIGMKPADATGVSINPNALQATTFDQNGLDVERTFRFGYVSGIGIGFFTVSKVPANTPYLVTQTNAPSFHILNEEEEGETAIECFTTSESGISYNLQGQIINHPSGLVICNGTKTLKP